MREDMKNEMTPILIFLIQELERVNKLVNMMNSTLSDLKKALSGEIILNQELELLAKSILNGFLP